MGRKAAGGQAQIKGIGRLSFGGPFVSRIGSLFPIFRYEPFISTDIYISEMLNSFTTPQMAEQPTRLNAETCRAKAEECRMLADQHSNQAHRVMLMHMAETWERIAKTFEN